MHLFEFLYYFGSSAKKHYSFRRRRHLPRKVISIGNITTGGTGKTPAAIAIAEEAKIRGFRPIILTRGYRGKAKGPCFVTKGEGPLLSVEDAGDEPILMAERLDGVPVVKGGDRYKSGIFALHELETGNRKLEPVIFILDDGFQHWRLHRDKDIALVDASNPFGNGMLLPFGRLREPLTALGRADVIVLSKSPAPFEKENNRVDAIMREIKRYNKKASVFFGIHRPISFRLISGEKKPPEWILGKKAYAFCGLGNPDSFRETILSLGARLVGRSIFRDHYRYKSSDVADVRKNAERCGAEWIVTTEKDIIKVRNLDLPDNIIVMEIDFSVEKGFFEEVFRL